MATGSHRDTDGSGWSPLRYGGVSALVAGEPDLERRQLDADGGGAVGDDHADLLGVSGRRDPGDEPSGAPARGPGRRARRPARPQEADRRRPDGDARLGGRARCARCRRPRDPGRAPDPPVRGRRRTGADRTDRADAPARARPAVRAAAGDRARIGEPEPGPRHRAGDRRSAARGDQRRGPVLRQRRLVPGGDRRGRDGVGAGPRPRAPARARPLCHPRRRPVRAELAGAARDHGQGGRVRLLREWCVGAAAARRPPHAGTRLRRLWAAARRGRDRRARRRDVLARDPPRAFPARR